jgi:hypothetical protein
MPPPANPGAVFSGSPCIPIFLSRALDLGPQAGYIQIVQFVIQASLGTDRSTFFTQSKRNQQ